MFQQINSCTFLALDIEAGQNTIALIGLSLSLVYRYTIEVTRGLAVKLNFIFSSKFKQKRKEKTQNWAA